MYVCVCVCVYVCVYIHIKRTLRCYSSSDRLAKIKKNIYDNILCQQSCRETRILISSGGKIVNI